MLKNQLLPIALLLISSFAPAQDCQTTYTNTQLATEKMRVELGQSGFIWHENIVIPADVPVEDQVENIFYGRIWMGGKAANGNLKLAGTSDYTPGPLGEGGTISSQQCEDFDRFWAVSKTEVDAFGSDFSSNAQVDGNHINITRWPGRGNDFYPSLAGFELPDQSLAPFVDLNNDGVYNVNDGDHPAIRGDQNIWWVYNDGGNENHISEGLPIRAEVQVMAYTVETEGTPLDVTTFYNFTIINKSFEALEEFLLHFTSI